MNVFGGFLGGGGGGKPPNPLIATSGKWLSICVGLYCAAFFTVDLWEAAEPRILDMIYERYEGNMAWIVYWLLRLAAYPMVFFAVKFGLGLAFVSIVTWIVAKVTSFRR